MYVLTIINTQIQILNFHRIYMKLHKKLFVYAHDLLEENQRIDLKSMTQTFATTTTHIVHTSPSHIHIRALLSQTNQASIFITILLDLLYLSLFHTPWCTPISNQIIH